MILRGGARACPNARIKTLISIDFDPWTGVS
jgi:hypothetical protein